MSVSVLRPPPQPCAPECANGCSDPLVWMAGPCQQQCAKTTEFQEQIARSAEAHHLRFRTEIGANVLRVVQKSSK